MKSYYFSHSHPGLNRINVVATTPETMEDVQSRLQTAAPDDVFSAQSEAFAVWIALTHPHYGDMYFVFVNSTSTVPGTSPPDLPATLNNTFQISSISKTFLGTAMLLLEERGNLSLNDAVGTFIPDFVATSPQYANYTVKNLLRMETYVHDFLNDRDGILNNYTKDDTRRYSPSEVVAYAGVPNKEFGYSTTNIVMGDVIVKHITGKAVQDVIRELILEPLNLTHTQLPDRYGNGALPKLAATPYAGSTCYDEFAMYGTNLNGLVLNQDITDMDAIASVWSPCASECPFRHSS
jgi:hypothetical protein